MTAIEFPISIALVGAPDSGKSAVAEKFAEISADFFSENESAFRVIENAGNTLQNERDTAMGVFGGYAEDLRAYFLQYEGEQEARVSGQSFLSLGTTLENLAHAGVTLENLLTGIQSQDTQRRAQQGQVSMSLLTFLFMERFRYTFAFYIPFAGAGLVLPGADDGERAYNQRIDMALRTIFVNFGLRVQVLDQPTDEEKAQEMFDTIKRIVENGPDVLPEDAEPSSETDEVVPPEVESTLTA